MFNIGDKVLFGKYPKKEHEATITDKHESNQIFKNSRYFITLETQLNVQGEQVKRWVDVTDLKLDAQYYREQKINQIIHD
jgi:hypothetical protein